MENKLSVVNKVYEFSVKKGMHQAWFFVIAASEANALTYARLRANERGAQVYAGPVQARCRWCDRPAVTMVGTPSPWAVVCSHHAEKPAFHRY